MNNKGRLPLRLRMFFKQILSINVMGMELLYDGYLGLQVMIPFANHNYLICEDLEVFANHFGT